MVLQDVTGGLIPLIKDSLGGIKEPVWMVCNFIYYSFILNLTDLSLLIYPV